MASGGGGVGSALLRGNGSGADRGAHACRLPAGGHTVKTPAYDTLRDFVPVAHLGSFERGLAVNASVPAKNLDEWLNWAKSDSRNAVFGTPGAGTAHHFLGLILAQASGVPLVNIPFRGAGPVITDLVAGQVPAAIGTLGALVRPAPVTQRRLGSQRAPAVLRGDRSR